MSRENKGIGVGWWVLLIAVVLSLVVFVFLLGPDRAIKISAASFLSTTVDGLSQDPGPHRLRQLNFRIDQKSLDQLESDLPWSGGEKFPATLLEHGVEYPVTFRYRGMYSASHYLGDKRSFRLKLKKDNPFAPYRKLNMINPKSFNMVNNHLGMWIAGRMGVPVPWNEMVYVRINDSDQGVMEMYEQIDGDFEKIRGIAKKEVPVFKGDYAPIIDRKLPPKRRLWESADHWEFVGKADSTAAQAQLKALISVVQDTLRTLSERRDTLAKLIDVDTYARYLAAMVVVNTKHMDQYHNQWLVLNERTGVFYPIFWDALLMFPPEGEPLYFINDAIAHWFLRIPEWRLLRDRYAYQALQELYVKGEFMEKYDHTIEEIQPSVLQDRKKYGHVSLTPADVHRFSVVHTISSFAGMRATVNAYWDRLNKRLAANDVTVERGEKLTLRSSSEAPFRLTWSGPMENAPQLIAGRDTLTAERKDGAWTALVPRAVALQEGSWDRPNANWQHYDVQPLNVSIAFTYGVPLDLTITNAITDAEIK